MRYIEDMNKNKATAATLALIATTALAACGNGSVPSQNSENAADAKSAVAALNSAREIELHKSAVSWGDEWNVKADGRKVATIKGLALKGYSGEKYTMLSPKGGIIGAEDEQIFHAARTATVYGLSGDRRGTLTKDIFSWKASYHLKDMGGNDLAKLDERMGFNFSGDVKDAHGSTAWHFDKANISWGDSIKVKRRSGELDAVDTVLMVAVANEVANAESKHK